MRRAAVHARKLTLAGLAAAALASTACRQDMYNQPKYRPLAENEFFADRAASRPLPPHTIPRGYLEADTVFFTGKNDDGTLSATFPLPVTKDLLKRGQERFNIYCSVCHGDSGDGDGMIVQRGYPPPPSYHIDRLRNAPPGYLYSVITDGYGIMYSYASRVEPRDRWAIAAYIRALQLSRNGRVEDLTAGQRAALEGAKP
jgi:mono/diheme cytochrome c family protein